MINYWRNGQPLSDTPTRACLYGDGLFETLRISRGQVLFWWHHWQRLSLGLRRLHFPHIAEEQVLAALSPALSTVNEGVLRLSVTRQGGQRGYRLQGAEELVFDVQLSPLPTIWHGQAVQARWCQTTWAQQPLLAGIKHLNRLEQVLARSEWTDSNIAEGLVCDTQRNVISGTMSAIMLRFHDVVLVANTQQSGVDSVARRMVMLLLPQLGYTVQVQHISKQDVRLANEVLIMNVVQGIAVIRQLNEQHYEQDKLLQDLLPYWQAWLNGGDDAASSQSLS